MKFKVINLTRTPERLQSFQRNNPHFKFDRYPAVDGKKLDRVELVRAGLATEEIANRYTSGALGVAMSHRGLWQECVRDGVDYTIIEDDARLIADFNNIAYASAQRNKIWDFIFWGANFDQRLVLELSPGIAAAEVHYNFNGIVSNIDTLSTQRIDPKIFRAHWAVGLVAYTVRPHIAQYLLNTIFPLRDYFDWRLNYGIDNSIIEELANIRAGLCLPPIALTLNDRHNSTVQEGWHGVDVKTQ